MPIIVLLFFHSPIQLTTILEFQFDFLIWWFSVFSSWYVFNLVKAIKNLHDSLLVKWCGSSIKKSVFCKYGKHDSEMWFYIHPEIYAAAALFIACVSLYVVLVVLVSQSQLHHCMLVKAVALPERISSNFCTHGSTVHNYSHLIPRHCVSATRTFPRIVLGLYVFVLRESTYHMELEFCKHHKWDPRQCLAEYHCKVSPHHRKWPCSTHSVHPEKDHRELQSLVMIPEPNTIQYPLFIGQLGIGEHKKMNLALFHMWYNLPDQRCNHEGKWVGQEQ